MDARRGLRRAAESLALVGYGLLTLDVIGADHAGWSASSRHRRSCDCSASCWRSRPSAGALAVRPTRVSELTGADRREVVAAVGTAAAAWGTAVHESLSVAPGLLLPTALPAGFSTAPTLCVIALVGTAWVLAEATPRSAGCLPRPPTWGAVRLS